MHCPRWPRSKMLDLARLMTAPNPDFDSSLPEMVPGTARFSDKPFDGKQEGGIIMVSEGVSCFLSHGDDVLFRGWEI